MDEKIVTRRQALDEFLGDTPTFTEAMTKLEGANLERLNGRWGISIENIIPREDYITGGNSNHPVIANYAGVIFYVKTLPQRD